MPRCPRDESSARPWRTANRESVLQRGNVFRAGRAFARGIFQTGGVAACGVALCIRCCNSSRNRRISATVALMRSNSSVFAATPACKSQVALSARVLNSPASTRLSIAERVPSSTRRLITFERRAPSPFGAPVGGISPSKKRRNIFCQSGSFGTEAIAECFTHPLPHLRPGNARRLGPTPEILSTVVPTPKRVFPVLLIMCHVFVPFK